MYFEWRLSYPAHSHPPPSFAYLEISEESCPGLLLEFNPWNSAWLQEKKTENDGIEIRDESSPLQIPRHSLIGTWNQLVIIYPFRIWISNTSWQFLCSNSEGISSKSMRCSLRILDARCLEDKEHVSIYFILRMNELRNAVRKHHLM